MSLKIKCAKSEKCKFASFDRAYSTLILTKPYCHAAKLHPRTAKLHEHPPVGIISRRFSGSELFSQIE